MSGSLERTAADSGSGNSPKKCVTVKIQLPETENTLAHTYNVNLKVEDLKKDIAFKFKIDTKFLNIFQSDNEVSDEQILSQLICNEFGIIEIQLKLTEEAEKSHVKLDTNVYYSNFTLPDIITVHCPLDSGIGTRDLVVEIENKSIVKPFIGGYKNKKTLIEYHNAFTQTGPIEEKIKYLGFYSRDTQTFEMRKHGTESAHQDRSTQAIGISTELLKLSDPNDYEIAAQDYEEYDEDVARRDMLKKVILIQRNFRRYRLQVCITECATKYRQLCAIKKKREARIKEDYIKAHKRPKDFPKTRKDFDNLFSQIAVWKEAETKRITEEFTGPTKIAELKALLEKEVQLLNGIDKRRLEIKSEQEHLKQDRMLDKLGETVKWIGYKNKMVEMDTLRTQRARFLADYFKKLRATETITERFELFQEILDVLSNEDSLKIFELDTLFEREKKLLLCNLNNEDLEVLRNRQLLVFMDIIKDEEHIKQEKDETKVCDKCKAVLPVAKFINSGNICKSCLALKKSKTDLSVYRAILRGIQREERRRGALSSLAFIIQETDIKKLIENIWHGHSILSQGSIMTDLRLPRWISSEDWSPWNCVCLTDTESRIHINCTNLDQIYGEKIIKDCHSKHSLARSMFKQFKDVDNSFVESGDWWTAGLSDNSL